MVFASKANKLNLIQMMREMVFSCCQTDAHGGSSMILASWRRERLNCRYGEFKSAMPQHFIYPLTQMNHNGIPQELCNNMVKRYPKPQNITIAGCSHGERDGENFTMTIMFIVKNDCAAGTEVNRGCSSIQHRETGK